MWQGKHMGLLGNFAHRITQNKIMFWNYTYRNGYLTLISQIYLRKDALVSKKYCDVCIGTMIEIPTSNSYFHMEWHNKYTGTKVLFHRSRLLYIAFIIDYRGWGGRGWLISHHEPNDELDIVVSPDASSVFNVRQIISSFTNRHDMLTVS